MIFAMSSGSKHLVGKSAIAKQDFNGSYGAFCALLRVSKVIIDSYIAFYFQGSEYRKLISEIAKGTNINNLKRDHILELQIPLPPVPEQRAIVTKIEQLFSELDNGIASLKKAQKQLKVYRQAVLKWAFEGKLTEKWREENKDKLETAEELLGKIKAERGKRYERELADYKVGKSQAKPKPLKELSSLTEKELAKLPQLPDEWGWVKLGELSGLITKGASPNWQGFKYVHDCTQVLFITSENVRKNYLDISEPKFLEESFSCKQKNSVLKKGDVLLNIVGASIGRAAVFNFNYNANINQAVALIRPLGNSLSLFLSIYLNSSGAQSFYNLKKVDVARANLSLADVASIPVPVTSNNEIVQIIEEIESRLSVADKLEETISDNLQKAEALRQSILKKAFAGKLLSAKELEAVRKDPEWEPAEKLIERIKAEKQHLGKGRKP